MTDAAEPRHPWQRLPGEGSRQYAAFCVYRELGPERTVRVAVEKWLTEAPTRGQHRRNREQRRYRTHPDPAKYLRNKHQRWRCWSRYWQWVGRCRSYDEHIDEQVRAEQEESQRRIRLAETEENERQAKTRLGTLRLGRQVASALLQRIAKNIMEGGSLAELPAEELVPHLAKIANLLEVCVKNERLELVKALPLPEKAVADRAGDQGENAEAAAEAMTDEQLVEYIRRLVA